MAKASVVHVPRRRWPVWIGAFLLPWVIAYLLSVGAQMFDGVRVDSTLSDVSDLARGLSRIYSAGPRNQTGVTRFGVRELIRAEVAPSALISPSRARPSGLFNAWGGTVEHQVWDAGIIVDMGYVPPKVCAALLARAHEIKGLARIAASGAVADELPLPVATDAARRHCHGRRFVRFIFGSPAAILAL